MHLRKGEYSEDFYYYRGAQVKVSVEDSVTSRKLKCSNCRLVSLDGTVTISGRLEKNMFVFKGVPAGIWYIDVVDLPKTHLNPVNPEDKVSIKVVPGQDQEVSACYIPASSLEVKLLNRKDRVLKGGLYELYDPQTNLSIYPEITNRGKKLKFHGLKEGVYFLRQVRAPKGYQRDLEEIRVDIGEKEDVKRNIICTHNSTDAHVKNILTRPVVLAWILKPIVAEFKPDITITEIISLLTEQYPNMKNLPVHLLTARISTSENDVVNEYGRTIFDIFFELRIPAELSRSGKETTVYIDLEPQNLASIHYNIWIRAAVYAALMLLIQRGRIGGFFSDDYDQVKKCYSIWICRNAPLEEQNLVFGKGEHKRLLYGNQTKPADELPQIVDQVLVNLSDTLEKQQSGGWYYYVGGRRPPDLSGG